MIPLIWGTWTGKFLETESRRRSLPRAGRGGGDTGKKVWMRSRGDAGMTTSGKSFQNLPDSALVPRPGSLQVPGLTVVTDRAHEPPWAPRPAADTAKRCFQTQHSQSTSDPSPHQVRFLDEAGRYFFFLTFRLVTPNRFSSAPQLRRLLIHTLFCYLNQRNACIS